MRPRRCPHVRPLGGALPPKNMLFGGVFRVIFKNYLVPQFCSDSQTDYGFANFRAISKTSRVRFLNFGLVLDLWDFEVGSSPPKSNFFRSKIFFSSQTLGNHLKRVENKFGTKIRILIFFEKLSFFPGLGT